MNKLENAIDNFLRNEELWTDSVRFYEKDTKYPFPAIVIEIRGDWKHEHLRLDNVMKEQGYIHLFDETTESDGSDCYTARHIFTSWEL